MRLCDKGIYCKSTDHYPRAMSIYCDDLWEYAIVLYAHNKKKNKKTFYIIILYSSQYRVQ
jgi:hypothetical protein